MQKSPIPILKHPSRDVFLEATRRPFSNDPSGMNLVAEIFSAVRNEGDAALRRYTSEYDGIDVQSFADVFPDEPEMSQIPDDLKKAIQMAAANIQTFHEAQKTVGGEIETTAGVRCWQQQVPIENVGIYIPGGTAPLFSTVLMLAIPAIVAGCQRIVLFSPPGEDGHIHPLIRYVAKQTGVHEMYRVGGAQAVAAMSLGTDSIAKVDKIFGPGNRYVTIAKQLASTHGVAIDLPAGPSEVAVIADAAANPDYVASDLLAQAEHGPDSQVVLFSDSERLISEVAGALNRQLEALPRQKIALQSLQHSCMVICTDLAEAMALSNLYAPEHLILNLSEARKWAADVVNAGSVFIGPFTPEALGDYASGTNHTLPTNGFARSYSGVNLQSFMKTITFQEASRDGLQKLGPAVEAMARAELLDAHANSVKVRLQ
jgi:histidinol dehydrogenase